MPHMLFICCCYDLTRARVLSLIYQRLWFIAEGGGVAEETADGVLRPQLHRLMTGHSQARRAVFFFRVWKENHGHDAMHMVIWPIYLHSPPRRPVLVRGSGRAHTFVLSLSPAQMSCAFGTLFDGWNGWMDGRHEVICRAWICTRDALADSLVSQWGGGGGELHHFTDGDYITSSLSLSLLLCDKTAWSRGKCLEEIDIILVANFLVRIELFLLKFCRITSIPNMPLIVFHQGGISMGNGNGTWDGILGR